MTAFDQSKRGLQDDHDPRDLGQKLADKPHGVEPTDATKQKPDNPPDADVTGEVGSQDGM